MANEPNFAVGFAIAGTIVNVLTLAINFKDQVATESQYSTLSSICTIAYMCTLFPIFLCLPFLYNSRNNTVPKWIIIILFIVESGFAWTSFAGHCLNVGCFHYETAIYIFVLTYLAVYAFLVGFLIFVFIASMGWLFYYGYDCHTRDQVRGQHDSTSMVGSSMIQMTTKNHLPDTIITNQIIVIE